MAKKRNVVNKAADIICQWCKEPVSSYGMMNHIRWKHRDTTVDEYVAQFGEFRNPKRENLPDSIMVKCGMPNCGKTMPIKGIATHLRDKHDLTPDQYVNLGYVEYRPEKIKTLKLLESAGDSHQCLICKRNCSCEKTLTDHIINDHKIPKVDYVLEYILHGIRPICKCGCGQPTKILPNAPFFRTVIAGHGLSGELNGMYGVFHSKATSEKMRKKAIARLDKPVKSSNTKPELEFKDFLHKNNIKYKFQEPTEYGIIDFYLIDYDLYVEIDGKYWHPTTFEKLNLRLLSSLTGQNQRKGMDNLCRIRCDDISKIQTIDDLYKFNFIYDTHVGYEQKIIHKSYFEKLSLTEKKKAVYIIWRFLNAYQPNFPEIETYEEIEEITQKIQQYDFSKLIDGDVFNNNSSNLGVSYLKSKFISFWKSAYKGNLSPTEAWCNDKIMRRIIAYRVGLNESGEVFDLSLRQLVRGISAMRHTVSFFKPVLAAAIYKKFLLNQNDPIVFDPCCGFGGRMLGFKSIYPDGKYIGCEPNLETYNELVELSKNFTNVQLFNCKLEDFDVSLLTDTNLTFTSIPYYDAETYSNPTTYSNFDEWVSLFITKLKMLPNLVVNVPTNLRYLFPENCKEYLVSSSTSHFNKTANTKTEFLIHYEL